jgi:pantothenate kinase
MRVRGATASEATFEQLLEAARRLSAKGARRILGLTGAPGAGKSNLADALVAALAPDAILVPMDGFHLAQAELARLGRLERKGAPDTFDAAGYVKLIRRLRDPGEDLVYVPAFDRKIEEPIAGAIAVPSDVPLVVTEGNYLLLETEPWRALRELLDEVWFLDPGDDLRVERLIARHVAFGKSTEAARTWSLGPDQHNADLVRSTRVRADRIVRVVLEGMGG